VLEIATVIGELSNTRFSGSGVEDREVSADEASVSKPPDSGRPWRSVHRALSDPLRIRLFEALWHGPRSAKELSAEVGLPPDRLYYHLRQLEQAGIIEVAEYRPLPNGKVERVYGCVEAEPPGDVSSPQEIAAFLGAVLDATKADINAAFLAKAAGKRREAFVVQGALRLTDEGLAEFQRMSQDLHERFGVPDAAGTQVRVLFAVIDLEERPQPSS
jgi:DNA-binding transcriptional ArsR family regulator